MSKPQVIDDQEHERVYERVAAVDVAKRGGVICVRAPHPDRPGQRQPAARTVTATLSEVRALADQLAAARIEKVTLESASDYWRIWYYVLEAGGLDVQLVSATPVKQVSGRPKTDRLDAMWLARLTEKGLLRTGFVPAAQIRVLRHYTRARTRLTRGRARCWQRPEKLLEDALIKVSAVASALTTAPAQDMIAALIAGERDPVALAGLARTRMKAKHGALVAALTGMFAEHHGQIAQLLTDQIAFCDAGIRRLTVLIGEHLAGIPAAWGVDADGVTGPGAGTAPDAPVLTAIARLDEIPGIGPDMAASIAAGTGPDMSRFPTPGHLVARAGPCPRALQSGQRARQAKGHRSSYLRGCLGVAATGAAGTRTFPGERYHRIARRRGAARARVAVARSILVIIWHLLADPEARYHDLGPGHYQRTIDKDRKTRSHIRQLQALGYAVTLTPAA